jgi:hypothetical protein
MSTLGDLFNVNQKDEFYFNGLDSGWFSDMFEVEFRRFPYIGARDRLMQLQKEKSLLRKLIESASKRVKMTSLISLVSEHLLGWKLPQGAAPNKLAEDIIKILDDEQAKRAVEEFLTSTQKQCRKNGRYFDAIGNEIASRGNRLCRANQATLHNQMIVLTGQLVHKSAIGQYNGKLAQTVSVLPNDWLISDYPPPGFVPENRKFDGRILYLTTGKEFEVVFQKFLPFRRNIGWYPYVRMTGFFQEPGYGESIPSLALVMCEFRPPKPYLDIGRDYSLFLKGELTNPIYLKDKSSLLLASYALPILAIGSNISDYDADAKERAILVSYLKLAGNEIPHALEGWYVKALTERNSDAAPKQN